MVCALGIVFVSKQSFCQDVQITNLMHRITEHLIKHESDWNEDYQFPKPFSVAKSYVQGIQTLRCGMDTNSVIQLLGLPDISKKRHGKTGHQNGYKFEYVLRKKERYAVNIYDELIVVCFDTNGMIESVAFEKGTVIDCVKLQDGSRKL